MTAVVVAFATTVKVLVVTGVDATTVRVLVTVVEVSS